MGKKPAHLKLLISDGSLIPPSFFLEYEKITGHTIEVQTVVSYHLYRSEAQQADLLFAPLAWLGSFPEILKPLPDSEKFRSELATDFSTLRFDVQHFLPVLWKVQARDQSNHLLFWGFATASDNPPAEIKEFLDFLLSNPVRLRDWAAQVPLAFTLQISNTTPQFPDSQKASRIREVPLDDLIIDQKF
jgi:hypothetical protein